MSSLREATPIAMLTGMPIELSVTNRPEGGELRVEALGGFHIEGIVEDETQISLFTRKDVPVRPGVWIAAGTKIRRVGFRPGALRVKKNLAKSQEPLQAWASCDSLTLDVQAVERSSPPKGARAYLSKERELTFYRSPSYSSAEVVSLTAPAYSDGLLLWGTHRENDFIRAYYRDEVVVEAWVHAGDLERANAAPSEFAPPRHVARKLPNLEVLGTARLFVSRSSVPIRIRASRQARVVGFIEPGTEVLVTDENRGEWAGVLPKSLALTAPEGRTFWVPAREVQRGRNQ